ncbi:MAG: acyclic terpene utilization AtuA family protein, partial [Pseudomonadales bacterium]
VADKQGSAQVLRVANCSGFYGDRLSAAREMVEEGPIDVLTGDYLAELTMAILYNQKRQRGEKSGFVGTFLKQVREVIALCLERNIKIVTNAGGLNPAGMATEIEAIVAELGLSASVAYIDGDNLIGRLDDLTEQGERFENIDKGGALAGSGNEPLTANVYLGGWGIAEALAQGADVVICPRVTDAAVVIGPAAWKFGWSRADYDALAGSLAAGHIIECGAQATGGNYSFFQEVPSFRNVGYPIAEIEADGSFTVTKHSGTGGLVSVGTVTAQLLYEISTPAYLNPDVVAHFDTLNIEQVGPDRVRVSGCRGSSPPPTHKVCINTAGGFRNGTEVILTGLDIEAKADIFLDALFDSLGGHEQFDEVEIQLIRSDKQDPTTNEEAFASLKIDVRSRDPDVVGRLFSAKIVELALANFPGFTGRSMAGSGSEVLVYWPALVDSRHVVERVHCGGKTTDVAPTSQLELDEIYYQRVPVDIGPSPAGDTVRIPFGRLFGTRSGDKGGCANLGVWARTDRAYAFLHEYLTVDELKRLLPDTAIYEIDRYDLPNLKAMNFYVHGILRDGVSSNSRIDGQAKSLGEYLRSKHIQAPAALADEVSA